MNAAGGLAGMVTQVTLIPELDLEGDVSGFTIKAISPLTDFSYDFHDLNFSRKE